MNFVGIHNHTEYSNTKLRDCIIRIKDLVNKGIEYGYQGIAITDHEVLSGHIEALKVRDSIQETNPDFKIMLGNEIYLIDQELYRQATKYYHFILIAKDQEGYRQIRALSSRAWERSFKEGKMVRTPTFYQDFDEIIGTNKGHLIASTACLGGELASAILSKDSDRLNHFINWMIRTFGKENCFLEMQDSDTEEQQLVNTTIIRIADFFGLNYLVSSDAHYLNKEDKGVHSAFLNSKEEKERETESFYKYTYVKSEEEIKDILSYLPNEVVDKAISNTMLIYDMVENFDIRHKVMVPQVKIPDIVFSYPQILIQGAKQYKYIGLFLHSEYKQDTYLLYLIGLGLQKVGIDIAHPQSNTYLERIDTELEVLWNISAYHNQRMSAYLNLVKRIIDIIWKVSIVGVGRGSCGGFLINYLVGITQINPLDYNLPYWRFLNNERLDDFPDIDIDVDPSKTDEIISLLREEFGQDNVLNTITFKTESSKSAVLTAARGRGISNDEAQVLSSMIPAERGKVSSIDECLGLVEGSSAVPGFKEALEKYNLTDIVRSIEGIISGRGIHASSIYIFNNGYLYQNSLMRAPNNTLITAFNMHDSDDMGALKFDLLRTDAQTKMTKCLELLLNDKQIQWQGDLRSTYNKYLHPDIIDYSDKKLWENIDNRKVMNLFQFETMVGGLGIQKVRPTSILEMSLTNDAMRLQGTLDGLSPIERFARYKKNVQLWYQEMEAKGITLEEQRILEKYLLPTYGNSINQETLMQILMDPKISKFSLRESNGARKILAKKLTHKVAGLKEDFYSKGSEVARKEFLDYIWEYFIEPQMGYSFSSIHSHSYSIVGLQEAYLATHFNPLYWDCACLSVNAGSSDTDFEVFGDEEEEEDSTEEVENKTVNTNYGKIAKALSDIQNQGVDIELPSINKAEQDFRPDIENGGIIYGLQAIIGMNNDIVSAIINNRPYTSLEDFMARVPLTTVQMISLIKSGAFDSLENKYRTLIMEKYLYILAKSKVTVKNQLTMTHFDKLVEYKIVPTEYTDAVRWVYFKKWIDKHCQGLSSEQKKIYIIKEEDECKFFAKQVQQYLTYGKDYDIINESYQVKMSAFKKAFDTYLTAFKEWMQSPHTREVLFYNAEIAEKVKEWQNKYCNGDISKWEMDSLSYYHSGHELKSISREMYNLVNFNILPEKPEVKQYRVSQRTGNKIPEYNIVNIAGTVLNSDKLKHLVTLLTTDGVVEVKFSKFTFIHYNKQISRLFEGKKQVIEKPWFARGNKLLISGYRRENLFIAQRNYTNGYSRLVQLITETQGNKLVLKGDREKE